MEANVGTCNSYYTINIFSINQSVSINLLFGQTKECYQTAITTNIYLTFTLCQVLHAFLRVVFKVPYKGMVKSTGSGDMPGSNPIYHFLPM